MNTVKVDIPTLRKICYEGFGYFRSMGVVSHSHFGSHTFINNGAKILGVAHLDTVFGYTGNKGKFRERGRTVVSSELDDRLGVHILLNELPKLGIKYDILFTEGEEHGLSTAQDFIPSKEYNWMFQFDRHGLWPVLYDYDTPELRERLHLAGFAKVDYGTFSDICYLDHVGCAGINFGAGYEDEHTYGCYAKLGKTEISIALFKVFYEMYKDEFIPYVPIKRWKSNYYGSEYWGEDGWDDIPYAHVSPTYKGNGAWVFENGKWRRTTQEDTDAQIAKYIEKQKKLNTEFNDLIDDEYWVECQKCKKMVLETEYNFKHEICQYCIDEYSERKHGL